MRCSLLLLVFVAVISIWWVINDIPQDSIVESKHPLKKAKLKEVNEPIKYYANSVAWYKLILSGDVKLNPVPGSRVKNKTAKCSIYNKAVGTNKKRIKCGVCEHLTYVSYLNISEIQQKIAV